MGVPMHEWHEIYDCVFYVNPAFQPGTFRRLDDRTPAHRALLEWFREVRARMRVRP